MKVFLSWSGNRSQAVANLMSDWLCCVVQACRPWISSRDLDRGSLWFGEINDQLKETSVGIICLSQENKDRPWILFEAGALAKGLSTARVCTFLIDLQPKDIEDPLAQFNHTLPIKGDMRGLVKTLNEALGQAALDHRILDQVFETYWPQFEKKFAEILANTKDTTPSRPRPKEDLLAEILENTRQLNARVRNMESENERKQYILNKESDTSYRRARELINDGAPLEYVYDRYAGVLDSVHLNKLHELYTNKLKKNGGLGKGMTGNPSE